ncbi:hypothetical protein A2239_02530 [Candidatus Uhrbacteria bacterium RIFOXYA2_FULL_40_9]|nr:MAG: hypothetical protein UT94_C0002G0015 [Candidatus Uhrbacteria bacterium GW2011_GWF2_40_263]OGL93952.1 MAG: hypothetical protein A2239_02530 [Candidatus Uhrbacteria bacterium RIFOXYA2_FULL_40_9]OGL97399.1 MAG: hypothetical protein A2332_04750 [Candidatus Uhrbacteria bacterium RIFOXYB2_FULL_41_18]HBK35010.1 hypothetical protein [Candidatus Uhrbacteria bacterium]HCB56164.1 hypothetical protein [Candidatus Uhrbacteria bacterium]
MLFFRVVKETIQKRSVRLFFALFLLLIVLAGIIFWVNQKEVRQPEFGITYSTIYAQELGLDPLTVYQALLTELSVKLVRLPVYWSEVEKEQGVYDWDQVDQLMTLSNAHGVEVTMVLGEKVPRWPECFIPDWALELSEQEREQVLKEFLTIAVQRYQSFSSLERWQIENEPFFPFGVCPERRNELVFEEIALVSDLDDHPVQLTVSGELESWWQSALHADVLGFSLYRVTWNKTVGFSVYPLSPTFYRIRATVMKWLTQKVIISELQAEPWIFISLDEQTTEFWSELFTPDDFEKNVQFAEQTGVSEVYFWGAEWWYYLRMQGFDSLWNYAENLFDSQTVFVKH